MPPVRNTRGYSKASSETLTVNSSTPPKNRRKLSFKSISDDGTIAEHPDHGTSDHDFIDLTTDANLSPRRSTRSHLVASGSHVLTSSRPTRRKSSANSGPSSVDVTNPDATSTSRPETITIRKQDLRPTVAFDTLWRWCAERKAIDDKRRSGKSAPWTGDPILRQHFFCNTFRVLDKISQYIITEVIEKGSQDPAEIVFRVVLFNTFTKIATWEILQNALGPLTWASWDFNKYRKVLGAAKDRGLTLYTGAFQKPAPRLDCPDNFSNHLSLVQALMDSGLPKRLTTAPYMADVFEFLVSFPGMGDFNAYQLLLNLSYTPLLNFSGRDFVIPGPGASSGLYKMFGSSITRAKKEVPDLETDVIFWLVKNQKEHFKRLGLEFSGLGPKRLPMDLADMEHAICEVDKYCRLKHPSIKGLQQRKQMKRAGFTPSETQLPKQPTLPKAWAHPARKVVCVRKMPLLKEGRYVVLRLVDERMGEDGLQYKVEWVGYRKNEATWEPEEVIMEDAPDALCEYLALKKKR